MITLSFDCKSCEEPHTFAPTAAELARLLEYLSQPTTEGADCCPLDAHKWAKEFPK